MVAHLATQMTSFFLSLLRAGVQPTLDPSAETLVGPIRLPRERGGELVGVCKCMCNMQGRYGRLSRREQLVGYLLITPPQGVAYCLANLADTYAVTAH